MGAFQNQPLVTLDLSSRELQKKLICFIADVESVSHQFVYELIVLFLRNLEYNRC